jgi:outer membrane biosynthesis protein TonB
MLPQTQPQRRRNSTRINLILAFGLHAVLVLAGIYLAARGGLLGHQFHEIAVELVKERPVEKPREKEQEEPQVESPKEEIAARTIEAPRLATAPVAATAAPSVPESAGSSIAPPQAVESAFEFDGGKIVQSSSDPVEIYRGFVEHEIRLNWTRPSGVADDHFMAVVEVSVDTDGRLSDSEWKSGSGNARWDDSVRHAIAATERLDRRPPAEFPRRFLVRFDVQDATEPILR